MEEVHPLYTFTSPGPPPCSSANEISSTTAASRRHNMASAIHMFPALDIVPL